MIVQTVPSGVIEVVLVDHQPHLQFNCACEDALPLCHAACCRQRPRFNVQLTEDEAQRLASEEVESTRGRVRVLPVRDGACTYLTAAHRCMVQTVKPAECRSYHCSPGGGSGTETVRSTGFALMPVLPR